jgi:hypothetical protein
MVCGDSDDCAVKLEVAGDEQALAVCLSELIANQSLRDRIGENARRYISEHHGTIQAARQYLDFLDQVRIMERRRSLMRAIIDETGRALTEIGVGDDDVGLIDGLAEQIVSLFRSAS